MAKLITGGLEVELIRNAWDSKAFESEMYDIFIKGKTSEAGYCTGLQDWIDIQSTRLGIDSISASIKACDIGLIQGLEEIGFRYSEMSIAPIIKLKKKEYLDNYAEITSCDCDTADKMRWAIEVAADAFANQRYQLDRRYDSSKAGQRYQNWVRSTAQNDSQYLRVIQIKGRNAAFFIYEESHDSSIAYWHLHAIAAEQRGKGYGKHIWQHMLQFHAVRGMKSVRTRISLVNSAALNLYIGLGSKLEAPEVRLHWKSNSLVES